MDSNFTQAAWSALERAADEAVQRRQKAIEPRHIVLGFLEGRAAANLLVRDMNVNRAGLAGALDDSLPRRQDEGTTARPSDLPYTGRAEQILDEARTLSRDDGRTRVGTADLLLAAAAEKGITRTILHQFDIEQERVRSTRGAHGDAIAAEDRGEEVEMEDEEAADRPAPEPEDTAGFDATDVRDRPESGGYGVDGPSGWPVSERKTREGESEEAAAMENEEAATQAADDVLRTKVEEAETRLSRSGPSGASLSFLSLDASAPRPLYRQIAEGIEEAAATGRIGSGARLPSIREAADALSVSSGTVARAYRELEEGEIVHTRGTRGTFVAAPEPAAATGERIRELADRLRAPVITGYHMGAGPEELHRALDRAMEGILAPRQGEEKS